MWSGKCPFGEMSQWGNVQSGNCPFGERFIGALQVGEVSVGELSSRGTVRTLFPFSWRCSIQEMAAFGGFLDPFSPKYVLSLLKFQPEVVFHKKKIVSERSFKIKCYSGNETYPKMMVLAHFRPNLPQGNPKYYQKPTFSQKLRFYNYQITQVLGPT